MQKLQRREHHGQLVGFGRCPRLQLDGSISRHVCKNVRIGVFRRLILSSGGIRRSPVMEQGGEPTEDITAGIRADCRESDDHSGRTERTVDLLRVSSVVTTLP